MAGPPRSVWVEVSTELLAELGDWSEPVQVMITDLRPNNGKVEMVLRSTDGPEADLATALRLLAAMVPDTYRLSCQFVPSQLTDYVGCLTHGTDATSGECPAKEALALLVRHGVREA